MGSRLDRIRGQRGVLVHVEIPDMSLNLQDPLLRLTGIHLRQTGGPLFCQILTDFARGRTSGLFYPGSSTGVKYYGLSENALSPINNYLSNRKHCVQLGTFISGFKDIYKGVSQGSILGSVLFNIFINDIFYYINDSYLRNYADDNTVTYSHSDPQILKSV